MEQELIDIVDNMVDLGELEELKKYVEETIKFIKEMEG